MLNDLQSTNGTKLNGVSVTAAALADGDEVRSAKPCSSTTALGADSALSELSLFLLRWGFSRCSDFRDRCVRRHSLRPSRKSAVAGAATSTEKDSQESTEFTQAFRKLVVIAGSLAGSLSINLTDAQVTIGRADDCTLVVTDDYALEQARPAVLPRRAVAGRRPRLDEWHLPRPNEGHPADSGRHRGTYSGR